MGLCSKKIKPIFEHADLLNGENKIYRDGKWQKKIIEMWATNNQHKTIAEFKNLDELNIWLSKKPIYLYVLYTINGGAIHVLRYKTYEYVKN